MGANLNGRLGPAVVPIGAVALVAGCSGGGITSNGAYVPNRPTTQASLQITIPARSTASASAKRSVKSIPVPSSSAPGSWSVGVRFVPVPAPAVTPTEQAFSLPTPGPNPVSTTLAVNGPIGADTVSINVYFAPQASPSPAGVVASLTQNTTLQNGTNNLSLNLLPVAYGAQVTQSGGRNAPAGPASILASWNPFEAAPAAQTAQLTITPVDYFGNLISGQTANGIAPSYTVNGAASTDVSFSASSITGQTTVQATYSAGASSAGVLGIAPGAPASNVPSVVAAMNATYGLALLPDSYIFAPGYSETPIMEVLDALTGAVLDTESFPSYTTTPIVAAIGANNACTAAATVVVADGGTASGGTTASDQPSVITYPISTGSSVTPTHRTTPSGTYGTSATAIAFDPTCTIAYIGNGYMGSGYLSQGSGFLSQTNLNTGVTSPTTSYANSLEAAGSSVPLQIGVANGTVWTTSASPGYSTGSLWNVAGGAASYFGSIGSAQIEALTSEQNRVFVAASSDFVGQASTARHALGRHAPLRSALSRQTASSTRRLSSSVRRHTLASVPSGATDFLAELDGVGNVLASTNFGGQNILFLSVTGQYAFARTSGSFLSQVALGTSAGALSSALGTSAIASQGCNGWTSTLGAYAVTYDCSTLYVYPSYGQLGNLPNPVSTYQPSLGYLSSGSAIAP